MANPWDFDTPVWLTNCNDYPDFVGSECAPVCSSNPIWCMLDLMTNKRYGLGNYMSIDDFDLDQLRSDAAYCNELVTDGLGGEEVRHRLDAVIDTRVKAMDLISQLSTSFRGLPFYSAGKIYLKIDRPQAFATQLFGMGNIIKDSYSQKWKSDKERFNLVEVQFLDKEKDYAQETIVVIDEEAFEVNNEDQKPYRLRLFVTRMSEAIREGRYAMKVSKYMEKVVSFKAQLNAVVAQPGDRIDTSHDVPQIGYSGTIRDGSTTTDIVLDREVTVSPSVNYRLKIAFKDDTIEEREITNTPGSYSTVSVSPAFSQAPEEFNKYIFGIENILVEPVRIVNLERDVQDNITMGCVQYKPEIYVDDILILPETQYSQLDTSFPVVTNLILTESIAKNEDGLIGNAINVSFLKPNLSNNPVNSYGFAKVYISDNNGLSWIFAGSTLTESFTIYDGVLPDTTYKVAVVVVNKRGVEGNIDDAAQASITTHTNKIPEIDLFAGRTEYKLDNVDLIQENLFDPAYTRNAFALSTVDRWNDVEGQEWDGFDMDDQTVEASGSIENTQSLDLGIKSKYIFSPVVMFKNNSGGSVTVQISKSDDDITFDSFTDINPATEYLTRYVKFKYILATSDTSEPVILYSAKIGIDTPFFIAP